MYICKFSWKFVNPPTEPDLYVCLLVLRSTKDQIVMVNGVSMENVHSNYTIQTLKSCGRTANVVSIEEASVKTSK